MSPTELIANHPAAAPSPPGAPRPWWETRWFVAAMILLAFVPLLYPQVPPLVDLPGHIGRYRIELDLASSPDLQRYFSFDWRLIGNLGVDLLVVPLARLVGLELAVKLVAMSIPPLTVAGFLWVAREVHHRLPPTVAFALPFAFSAPYLYGFVNYTLSMALAFLAFGLWLRLGRLERLRLRAILFVPISFLIYICHTFGWGTLGLLAFSAEAVRQHDKGAGWWRSALLAAMQAAVMAGPILLMIGWRDSISQGMTADWFNWRHKALWLVTVLRDRWNALDAAMVALLVLVFWETIRRRELTFSRNLLFSALVLLAFFLVIPRIVFGSAFADMRLLPYCLATALLGIRFREETDLDAARKLAAVATAFFLLKVGATTASMAIAADNQSARLKALDHVPRGAAMVNIVGDGCGMPWPLPRNAHIGGLAIARRHAFSNDQWIVEGVNSLSVQFRGGGRFRADPSQMIRPNHCGNREHWAVDKALSAVPRATIDYVWTVDLPPHDPRTLAGYVPIWTGEGSTLYAAERLGRAQSGRRSTQP